MLHSHPPLTSPVRMAAVVSQSYWCGCPNPHVCENQCFPCHRPRPPLLTVAYLYSVSLTSVSPVLPNWSLPSHCYCIYSYPFLYPEAFLCQVYPPKTQFVQGAVKMLCPGTSSQSFSPRLGLEAINSPSQHVLNQPSANCTSPVRMWASYLVPLGRGKSGGSHSAEHRCSLIKFCCIPSE